MPPIDLAVRLPILLPLAIRWAEDCANKASTSGRGLNQQLMVLARAVGVRSPEQVRVLIVDELPSPSHRELREAALQSGLLGPASIGLTLGHSIFILSGHVTVRLLSQELRHVFQYECAGSIADFLPQYLGQIVALGYDKSQLEMDARAHEIDELPALDDKP